MNLEICVTPQKTDRGCYTDTQDTQELERLADSKENLTTKEIQEKLGKKGTTLTEGTKNCVLRHGPYIPTTAELAEELANTSNIRRTF